MFQPSLLLFCPSSENVTVLLPYHFFSCCCDLLSTRDIFSIELVSVTRCVRNTHKFISYDHEMITSHHATTISRRKNPTSQANAAEVYMYVFICIYVYICVKNYAPQLHPCDPHYPHKSPFCAYLSLLPVARRHFSLING